MDLPGQNILVFHSLGKEKTVILLLELYDMLKYCRPKSPFTYFINNNQPTDKTLSLSKRVNHMCQPYALICLCFRIRSYMRSLCDLIYSFSQNEAYGAQANSYKSNSKSKTLEQEMCKFRF